MTQKALPPHPKFQRRARLLQEFEVILREGGWFWKDRLYRKDGAPVVEAGPTARLDFANRQIIQRTLEGRWVWKPQTYKGP